MNKSTKLLIITNAALIISSIISWIEIYRLKVKFDSIWFCELDTSDSDYEGYELEDA